MMTPDERKAHNRVAAAKYRATHPERLRASQKAYREKEREKYLAYCKAYKAANSEKLRAYQAAHLEHRRAAYQARYVEHGSASVASVARRRAAKAVPPWVDLAGIKAVYQEAASLTRETGIPHDVDHIIPQKSPFVSGLHVPWNLQILTHVENVRKARRFERTA